LPPSTSLLPLLHRQAPTSVSKDVLHFIYFSTAMNQFVAPGLSPPYSHPKSQQRLLRHYQSLALWLHRQQPRQRILCLASGHFIPPPHTPCRANRGAQARAAQSSDSTGPWRVADSQTMLAWVDRDLELYMALSPLAVPACLPACAASSAPGRAARALPASSACMPEH
jgi:hypothetical protein